MRPSAESRSEVPTQPRHSLGPASPHTFAHRNRLRLPSAAPRAVSWLCARLLRRVLGGPALLPRQSGNILAAGSAEGSIHYIMKTDLAPTAPCSKRLLK